MILWCCLLCCCCCSPSHCLHIQIWLTKSPMVQVWPAGAGWVCHLWLSWYEFLHEANWTGCRIYMTTVLKLYIWLLHVKSLTLSTTNFSMEGLYYWLFLMVLSVLCSKFVCFFLMKECNMPFKMMFRAKQHLFHYVVSQRREYSTCRP